MLVIMAPRLAAPSPHEASSTVTSSLESVPSPSVSGAEIELAAAVGAIAAGGFIADARQVQRPHRPNTLPT